MVTVCRSGIFCACDGKVLISQIELQSAFECYKGHPDLENDVLDKTV